MSNTCATCPDTTRYATSLDKAVGTFVSRAHMVAVHCADGAFSSNSLSNKHFTFAGVAGQMAHAAHTGGGWLVVWGDHNLGTDFCMDVAIWEIAPDGTFRPLPRTDKRIRSHRSLRFGTDFNIIDAWPI